MSLPFDLELDDAPDVMAGGLLAIERSESFKARGYQIQAFESCVAAWEEGHRKLLAVLATGTGKTLIFSMLAHWAVKNGGKVLILAHQDELIDQAAQKLKRVSDIDAAREKADDYAAHSDPVVVSSIQTMSRPNRLATWPKDHFSLIICDECARIFGKTWQDVLAYFDTAKVLGVTATPKDEKNQGEFFDKKVFEYGLKDAVIDGYLVEPRVLQVPMKVDLRGLALKKGKDGSELDPDEVGRRLEPFLDEIAKMMVANVGNRVTMGFLPSVDSAQHLAEKLKSLGVKAEWVAGDKKRCPGRSRIIQDFRDGKFQFILSALLGVEGFDYWRVSCAMCFRATTLASLLRQIFGRATRPLDGLVDRFDTPEERRAAIAASIKPDALLLDPLFLTDRLDLVHGGAIMTDDPEMLAIMAKEPNGNLMEIEERAKREALAAALKETAKHAKKTARLFNPVEMAIAIGDGEIKDYKPTMPHEFLPVSAEQKARIEKLGGNPYKVKCAGEAAKVIETLERREASGLCSAKQMLFLQNLGITKDELMYMRKDEASRRTRQFFAHDKIRQRFGMPVKSEVKGVFQGSFNV